MLDNGFFKTPLDRRHLASRDPRGGLKLGRLGPNLVQWCQDSRIRFGRYVTDAGSQIPAYHS
jgi:hypothetical protein